MGTTLEPKGHTVTNSANLNLYILLLLSMHNNVRRTTKSNSPALDQRRNKLARQKERRRLYAPRLGTKRERIERAGERKNGNELRSVRARRRERGARGEEKGEYLRRVEKPTRVWPDTHTSGPTHGPPAGASFSFTSRECEISVCARACMRAFARRLATCARARVDAHRETIP